MKAIDINRRCAECDHETDDCVKFTTKDYDICFDNNKIETTPDNREYAETLFEVTRQRDFYRKTISFAGWVILVLLITNILLLIL